MSESLPTDLSNRISKIEYLIGLSLLSLAIYFTKSDALPFGLRDFLFVLFSVALFVYSILFLSELIARFLINFFTPIYSKLADFIVQYKSPGIKLITVLIALAIFCASLLVDNKPISDKIASFLVFVASGVFAFRTEIEKKAAKVWPTMKAPPQRL